MIIINKAGKILTQIITFIITMAILTSVISDFKVAAAPHYFYSDYPVITRDETGHRYLLLSATFITWDEAIRHCESLGGHLATIDSKEENDFIYNYISSLSEFNAYFGLYRDGNEWKWVTGEPVVYTNWATGNFMPDQPNDDYGVEDYGMFYWGNPDGGWFSGDFGINIVGGRGKFICEWDASDTPTDQAQSQNTTTALEKLIGVYEGTYKSNDGYNWNASLDIHQSVTGRFGYEAIFTCTSASGVPSEFSGIGSWLCSVEYDELSKKYSITAVEWIDEVSIWIMDSFFYCVLSDDGNVLSGLVSSPGYSATTPFIFYRIDGSSNYLQNMSPSPSPSPVTPSPKPTPSPTPTPSQVQTLKHLREVKYPNGKFWNRVGKSSNNPNGYTSTPCPAHSNNQYLKHCNNFGGYYQCWGFVNKLYSDLYGENPGNNLIRTRNLDNIKPGDVIRYGSSLSSAHSVFVLRVQGNNIYIADCNGRGSSKRCVIQWGGTKTKKDILSRAYVGVKTAPYSAEQLYGLPGKVVRVKCPVDVVIYDEDGTVVGRVINNEVDYDIPIESAIAVSVDGDDKEIILPSLGEFTFQIIGTDEGTMDVSITDIDLGTLDEGKTKEYLNIALETGKEFVTEISALTDTDDIKLYVSNKDEGRLDEVTEDEMDSGEEGDGMTLSDIIPYIPHIAGIGGLVLVIIIITAISAKKRKRRKSKQHDMMQDKPATSQNMGSAWICPKCRWKNSYDQNWCVGCGNPRD